MENLETIMIPSGDGGADLDRMSAALGLGEWLKSQGRNIRYYVSGVGKDLNKALDEKRERVGTYFGKVNEGYEVHSDLWNSVVNYADNSRQGKIRYNPVGIDTHSRNSYENFASCFPRGFKGKVHIVSRPLHLLRFKMMEDYAKKEMGILSNDAEIHYVNAHEKFSIKNLIYDIGSLGWSILTGGWRLRKAYVAREKYNIVDPVKEDVRRSTESVSSTTPKKKRAKAANPSPHSIDSFDSIPRMQLNFARINA